MVFNGAPSFAAALSKNADCGQVIYLHGEKTENHLAFVATGIPAAKSPELVMGDNEEGAAEYDSADPQGRKLRVKAWWVEADHTIISKLAYVKEKNYILQVIRIQFLFFFLSANSLF